ncbi:serine hydrolase domain-containing protein (plasmid) [Streptomyces sp. BI20]|uniref:serine hydrolase domain-containing protein n=1 Tax=Streptomyces sp. BI20 TaxID=3403460 RepID=UPI003C770CBC
MTKSTTSARARRAAIGVVVAGLLATPLASGTAFAAPPDPSPSATTGSAPAVPAGFPRLDAATAARLDAAVERVRAETGVPGIVVSLSAPGKGEYTRAFGVADKATGAAMRTDLYHRIGSVTKTFTVTALLRLVDQGKVGLDDPVGRWVSGVPNGDRITLRDLADMRSGLFNYSADEGFAKALMGDPKRSFTPRELLDYAFAHPVGFAPGARFEYCNTNTILLGLVVEKASGTPLNEYVEREVARPAGLTHTTFPTDAAFPDPHAQGYTDQTASGRVETATDWNPSWGWAAGAMISDLNDLRTWARVLATGTLLSPRTQAERLQGRATTEPGATYGLGLFDVDGWIGHNGSLPGYQTLVLYLPEAKATLVATLNTDITHDGVAPSTLLGKAVTQVVTPEHVYDLPRTDAPPAGEPSAGPS